jgi:hypothetical protein
VAESSALLGVAAHLGDRVIDVDQHPLARFVERAVVNS